MGLGKRGKQKDAYVNQIVDMISWMGRLRKYRGQARMQKSLGDTLGSLLAGKARKKL